MAADAADPVAAGQLLGKHRPRTLVLNAGAAPPTRPVYRHAWQTFSRNWDVDMQHVFNYTREALLIPSEPGSVVIAFSSGAAVHGSPLSGGYEATIRFIASYPAAARRFGFNGDSLDPEGVGVTSAIPSFRHSWPASKPPDQSHRRRRRTVRKLIESTLVSLDGVTEAPERWASFDAEDTALSMKELGSYDGFVLGRVTYEMLFAYWGRTAGDPYIDLINAMPKYVASRSLTGTAWSATLLGPDPSRAIAKLKDQPGKDLIKYGTSRLDDTLMRDHLIDEFRFWIRPVVAGPGQRLFEHVDTSGLHFTLTGEKRLENGSVILTYAPG